MEKNSEERQLLVDLLREASKLEHCLLLSYLFTACSLKSTPEEFALTDDKINNRRAIQFERVRVWKQVILNVAVEEMTHLHYVQCMLRALGEPPALSALPNRDTNGNWVIPNWKACIGNEPINEGNGVVVPLEPLTMKTIGHFVLYESTDALQDNDPFGKKTMKLFEKLNNLELDLRLQSMFYNLDEKERQKFIPEIKRLYSELTPLQAGVAKTVEAYTEESITLDEVRFQSIADFYYEGILPLYEQAFDFGWVKNNNRNLNNEFQDFPAEEGFLDQLAVGPVYRSLNFSRLATKIYQRPSNFKRISEIIKEIVDEGEGASNFDRSANNLIEKLSRPNGTREYLEDLYQDQNPESKGYKTPEWLVHGQNLRMSHLYRFAMIMMELSEEMNLSKKSGTSFKPGREQVPINSNVFLKKFAEEIPFQFNSCYLVLQAWLSRMYEIPDWEEDKQRRKTIEMLASWPLMSVAIRPFLELMSFFPIDPKVLFRLEHATLPTIPTHARQLLDIFMGRKRSEETNHLMDYLILHVLSDVARWAGNQLDLLKSSNIGSPYEKMILSRLEGLAELEEFQKQFEFRVHGGYSNQLPDNTYQQESKDPNKFQEDPSVLSPLYKNTYALRIKFSGWGLVQQGTDPDPPTDEVGCTGTLMVHPADNTNFDYSIAWQNNDQGTNISREPTKDLPELGVNCVDVSLIYVGDNFQAGYIPLQVMSQTGAVQASGVQMDLVVAGFSEVWTLTPEEIFGGNRKIRINLLEKKGNVPRLIGLNHVVSKDGEPIDPFIIAVEIDPKSEPQGKPSILFQREIYNEDKTFLQMSPLQRALSARFPVGFESFQSIPEWVLDSLSLEQRKRLKDADFPNSYLFQRAQDLSKALSSQLKLGDSQKEVDKKVSFVERMLRISPFGRSTNSAWLGILLHYGHTVSGDGTSQNNNLIFDKFSEKTNLKIALVEGKDRHSPNNKWLSHYTLGVMDTDALSNLVFGELYLPVTVEIIDRKQPVNLKKTWKFDVGAKSQLQDLVRQFNTNPFWAFPSSRKIGNKSPCPIEIDEALASKGEDHYTCRITGLEGISNYNGSFVANQKGKSINLEWEVSFQCDDPNNLTSIMRKFDEDIQQMSRKLTELFKLDMG